MPISITDTKKKERNQSYLEQVSEVYSKLRGSFRRVDQAHKDELIHKFMEALLNRENEAAFTRRLRLYSENDRYLKRAFFKFMKENHHKDCVRTGRQCNVISVDFSCIENTGRLSDKYQRDFALIAEQLRVGDDLGRLTESEVEDLLEKVEAQNHGERMQTALRLISSGYFPTVCVIAAMCNVHAGRLSAQYKTNILAELHG